MEKSIEKIGVKFGSTSVASKVDGVYHDNLDRYAQSVAELQSSVGAVALITSGAAYTGESIWKKMENHSRELSPQLYAGMGIASVIYAWQAALSKHGVASVFLQPTHHEIDDRVEGRMFTSSVNKTMSEGVVPIINANDMLSTEELIKNGWGDNDGLAAHVATAVGLDRLLLMTDVRGLLRCEGKYLVKNVGQETDTSQSLYSYEQALGFAGYVEGREPDNSMSSKMKALFDIAKQGVTGHIAYADSRLVDVINGKTGTTVWSSTDILGRIE